MKIWVDSDRDLVVEDDEGDCRYASIKEIIEAFKEVGYKVTFTPEEVER